MAGGFKRGGFRGGGFKKGYAKKRPNEDEDAPSTDKRSKMEDDDANEPDTPLVPSLQTDDDNNQFIAVSFDLPDSNSNAYYYSSITAANDELQLATSRA